MPSQQNEQQQQSRFEHLLKPIKELTETWGIDAANELSEYLEELQSLTIAFEGEERREVDFAEAALIIQQSTKLYGKNVDRLSELVETCLTAVQKKTAASRLRERCDEIDDGEDVFGNEAIMLILDLDTIEEAPNSKINLPDTHRDEQERHLDELRRRSHAGFDVHAAGLSLMDSNPIADSGAILLDGGESNSVDEFSLDAPREASGSEDLSMADTDTLPDPAMADGEQEAFADADMASPGDADHEYAQECYEGEEEEEEEEEEDPYAPLDPHDPMDGEERLPVACPYRKGKTWAKPRRSTGAMWDSDTGADPVLLGLPSDRVALDSGACAWHAPAQLRASHFAAGGVTCAEFTGVAKIHYEKERAARRKAAAAARKAELEAQQRRSGKSRVGVAVFAEDEDDMDHADNFTDDAYEDDDFPGVADEADSGTSSALPALFPVENVESSTYEDLARRKLEQLKIEADRYQRESDITRAVEHWSLRLQPLLDEQDQRSTYDVQEYSQDFIGSLDAQTVKGKGKGKDKGTGVTTFADILAATSASSSTNPHARTQGACAQGSSASAPDGVVPRHEVCRQFFTALVLAKDENIDIEFDESCCDEEGTVNRFHVKLINDKLRDVTVSEFRAPSVVSS